MNTFEVIRNNAKYAINSETFGGGLAPTWGAVSEALAVSQVEACAREIDNWMCRNKLKLNGDKSELLVISSQYRPRPVLSS